MLRSEIGINVINKRNLIDDELFNIKYRELKEFDNKIYISLGICILGIVFTVVASKYLGWEI
ncbi:MAG: hypothetical protein GTN59_16370, partial [Candidatus Dadabacteria bacterium]|nr:hypothetical protein [Candidatus Dadabacteria bacterium]